MVTNNTAHTFRVGSFTCMIAIAACPMGKRRAVPGRCRAPPARISGMPRADGRRCFCSHMPVSVLIMPSIRRSGDAGLMRAFTEHDST